MIFFTADCHFDHQNIIKYTHRPFANTDEMNQVMLDNWNAVVEQNDTVYILGDFVFRSRKDTYDRFLSKLNGKKILIKGNHDKEALNLQKKYNYFEEIKFYEELRVPGFEQKICLFHYPIENWNGKHHGSVHLHGHSHGSTPKQRNRFDVGVDVFGFKPISIEELKNYVETQV